MRNTAYHALLRIFSLTLALVLLFESGLISPLTQDLSHQAGRHVASVIGMNAAVQPTELNTLTAQLTERERTLTEREIAVGLKEQGASSDASTYILSILLFILLVLIILNYALDYVRNKKAQYEQAA